MSLENESVSQWESFLKRCRVFMKKEYKILFELVETNEWDRLDELLEQEEISLARQKHIKDVLAQKKQSQVVEIWESIEEFIQIERSKEEKSKYYLKARKLQSRLEQSPYIFSRSLGLIVLAIKTNNFSWAKKELYNFLNFHPMRFTFEIHRGHFHSDWNTKRFEKLILDIGLEISTFFKKTHPLEVDIFMTLMQESFNSRTFNSLSSKYQTQWSLTRLREAISSGHNISAYPSFWYAQLSHRTSRGQVDSFINSLFKEEAFDSLGLEALWIFTETMPSHEEKRKKIQNLIFSHSMNDPYLEYVVLHLAENEAFKRLLSESENVWSKPNFQLKRSLFRELFWNDINPELMIFHLLSLGDYNSDYLWALSYPHR